jgi:Uma2 family endonuclease
MSVERVQPYTVAEYLEFERQSPERHEFHKGEMFLMTGASRWHNLIVTNLCRELSQRLKDRPCRVYPSDLRVHVSDCGLYTYPDVTIVCGEEEYLDDHQDTLLNPLVLIEVLSDSTEKYDRGRKFEMYRTIDSLGAYVLVSQDRALVEVYELQEDRCWKFSAASGLEESILIGSLNTELSLAEVYDKVEFPPLEPVGEDEKPADSE